MCLRVAQDSPDDLAIGSSVVFSFPKFYGKFVSLARCRWIAGEICRGDSKSGIEPDRGRSLNGVGTRIRSWTVVSGPTPRWQTSNVSDFVGRTTGKAK
jgi:hypothetical protein